MKTPMPKREWAPDDDDRPCPCGVNHTAAEHGYDPEAEAQDPDDEVQDGAGEE